MKYLKVGKWKQTREVRKKKSSKDAQMQPFSLEITVGLSPKRGAIRLWLALPFVGRSKEI